MQSKAAMQLPMQPGAAQQPISIEDKLSKPLDASIGAARQPQHSIMDPTLILQLPASPVGRSAALGRGHPAASRSHPVAGRAPQHDAAAALGHDSSFGRSGTTGTTSGQGPRNWGLARPDAGIAAQPSVVQRLGRPSSAGQEPRIRCCAGPFSCNDPVLSSTPCCCGCQVVSAPTNISMVDTVSRQPERSNGAAARPVETALPPKRRSVLDRLGPRLGNLSSDSSPPSSRQPTARASDSDQAERPAKRASNHAVSAAAPSCERPAGVSQYCQHFLHWLNLAAGVY